MAMELQGLIDRIQQDGVQQADQKKQQIIKDAEAHAKNLIENAKNEAKALIENAKKEADAAELRAKSAIQQAARDILRGLRQDAETRLNAVTRSATVQTLTPETIRQIILTVAAAQSAQSASEVQLHLVLPAQLQETAIQQLLASLAKDFKTKPEISVAPNLTAGLKVGFKGSDLFLDFSDTAITEMLCAFVGPKVAQLISGTSA